MKVLVTGAAGFIGSHLTAALLAGGHDVHVVLRPSGPSPRLDCARDALTAWDADLADRAAVRRAVRGAAPDAVVHLAWYTEPGRYLDDRPHNLRALAASAVLVAELVDAGCPRLVLGGTSLEAAGAARGEPTYYATAKRAVHALATAAGGDGMSVACGHVFSVYGPGEHPGRAISSITRALLRGETIDVTAGAQLRDYLHVADVAAALCALVESDVTDAVDICSGRPRPLADVFRAIGEATGRGHLIRWGTLAAAPGEDFDAAGDPRRLADLGWTPAFSLAEGIRETVAWWEAQGRPGALAATEDR
jgi:nucleoside-diphosphate-sugar epimerase